MNNLPPKSTSKWVIFFLYVLLGLLTPLLLSCILSVPKEKIYFGLIQGEILILIFGGMLGGLLNSFRQDATLELPHCIPHEGEKKQFIYYSLAPGFLGDCLLGITGAFISFLLLHKSVLPEKGVETLFEYKISLVALAALGGYSGKVIIEAALGKLLKSEIQKFKHEQARVAENVTESKLIEDVNEQISVGLPEEKLSDLLSRIRDSSAETKDKILARVKLIRRSKSGSKAHESKSLAKNMLPVVKTLCESSSTNARYWAEQAYVYIDIEDWRSAIMCFNEAILRSQDRPKYYLNRALAKVKEGVHPCDEIFNDLKKASSLDSNLTFKNEAFHNWVNNYRDWLNQQGDFGKWLTAIFPDKRTGNANDFPDDPTVTNSEIVPAKLSPAFLKEKDIDNKHTIDHDQSWPEITSSGKGERF